MVRVYIMFGNKKKLLEKDNEISQLKLQLDSVEKQLASVNEQCDQLQSKMDDSERYIQFYLGMFGNLNGFSDSLSALQGTLAHMAETLKDEKRNAIETATEISNAQRISDKVTSELKQFGLSVEKAVPHTESLRARADAIGNIISLISNVSDQTNLLALNAAIEAARAGENGRGFAVVADEVRVLSKRTSDATQDITTEVNSIQSGAIGVQEQMNMIAEKSRELSSDSDRIHGNMAAVIKTANHLEETVSAGALRSFVELAKADHLVFKFEIYKVLMGQSDKHIDDFSSHTSCRLGQWYNSGEGVQCYSELPGYREMNSPHERVHSCGKRAIERMESGDLEAAVNAVAEMEEASLKVQESLEMMASSAEAAPAILCHAH